jgi:hypothetical protein
MTHEQQAPPAGAFQVFEGDRVGDVRRVKPRPLIGDPHLKALGGHPKGHPNFLGMVHPVAMLDGIDERFFEGKLDAEDFPLGELVGFQSRFDFVLNSMGFGRVAGDFDLPETMGGVAEATCLSRNH